MMIQDVEKMGFLPGIVPAAATWKIWSDTKKSRAKSRKKARRRAAAAAVKAKKAAVKAAKFAAENRMKMLIIGGGLGVAALFVIGITRKK